MFPPHQQVSENLCPYQEVTIFLLGAHSNIPFGHQAVCQCARRPAVRISNKGTSEILAPQLCREIQAATTEFLAAAHSDPPSEGNVSEVGTEAKCQLGGHKKISEGERHYTSTNSNQYHRNLAHPEVYHPIALLRDSAVRSFSHGRLQC